MSSFKDLLDGLGISQADLARKSGVNAVTINFIAQARHKGKNVATRPVTKTKLVKAINEIATTNFSVQDVFPN